MSVSGTCKFFNNRKGYGFITDTNTQTDYFVHTSGIDDDALLKEGDEVTFEIGQGNDGREKAINVTGGTGQSKSEQRQYNDNDRGFGNRGGDRGFGGGNSYGRNNYGNNNYGGNRGGYEGGQGGYGGRSQGGFGGRSQGGFGRGGDQQKKICYNWRDNGECRFGESCRFLHENPQN